MTGRGMGVTYRYLQTCLTLCASFAVLISALEMEEEKKREDYEKDLIAYLFDNNGYNPLVRPVRNNNDTLDIAFNLALSQIIHLDEVNQVMKTNVWLQLYWTDYQLSWDPALFGNIGSIRIPQDKVWVPDFVLFNNADGNFEVTFKSNCVLYSNAEINWIPPAIYHSSCSIDVKYFPFDQQTCEMKFGSWSHKGKSLKYTFRDNRDKVVLADYLKSGSWDIIDCPGKIVNVTDITGDVRELIVFEFILRRKTLFYTVNLIIPCVLISFVTVCVFVLPAHRGQKIALCISVLFALVVFLLLVSKILPPSLTIPLIAKYLLFTFLMNFIAIFATVIVINRNWVNPHNHTMPPWVRVVFLRELPKYLLMSRPDFEKRWKAMAEPEFDPPECINNQLARYDEESMELADRSSSPNQITQLGESQSNPSLSDEAASRQTDVPNGQEVSSPRRRKFVMTPEIRRTVEAVNFIYTHLKLEQNHVMMLEEWKYVAKVLDRLLLIIFLLITFSGTAGILINAPHILEFVDQDKIIRELQDYLTKVQPS
ncbi:acetylcholine receptor subunit beta-like 1 [Biomphalaria glabrata]|uniref:Acetylcholine receptor subunit beta-like 1 n=1 Tax=Biomphalaria glabrata TaxID=6526 RepID=A0A2C9JR97_BIOGL|nr:acetylcholine receptor subunit beta-like 1 [Biomphalaria glabrata]